MISQPRPHTGNIRLSRRRLKLPLILMFLVGIALHAALCLAAGDGNPAGTEAAAPIALTDARETLSMTASLFRLTGALALVVGLMLLLVRWLRRSGFGRTQAGSSSLIRVLETRMIAPKKFLAVVQAGGENLLLAISEQHIQLLTKMEGELGGPAPAGRADNEKLPFAGILGKILQGRQENRPDHNSTPGQPA